MSDRLTVGKIVFGPENAVLPGRFECEHGPAQFHGKDCDCVRERRRREPTFRHHEVMIIGAFAQAVIDLHRTLNFLGEYQNVAGYHLNELIDQSAYSAARLAIHCAHMLELKEDCR